MRYTRRLLLTGNANRLLAESIAQNMLSELGECDLRIFEDGEMAPRIISNVRGADVFIIQPTCKPAPQHLQELLFLVDAARRASADRITAVMPYYGFARQDRKDRPRVSISAKVIAKQLEVVGVNRVITLDLHAAAIQGFFEIPVDNLYAGPMLARHFMSGGYDVGNLCVVSPDAGGVERARKFAKTCGNAPLAIIDKRRENPNESEVMNIIGDVTGKDCLIVDDLVDTAGTLVKAAVAILEKKAKSVRACSTHAVLSGKAIERIENSPLTEVVFTDSIPLSVDAQACTKIKRISVANLLARAIQSIHEETSVSALFG